MIGVTPRRLSMTGWLGAVALSACSTRDFEAGHRAPTAFPAGIPTGAANAEGVDWRAKTGGDAVIPCRDACFALVTCGECCFYTCLCKHDPVLRRACGHARESCEKTEAAQCL